MILDSETAYLVHPWLEQKPEQRFFTTVLQRLVLSCWREVSVFCTIRRSPSQSRRGPAVIVVVREVSCGGDHGFRKHSQLTEHSLSVLPDFSCICITSLKPICSFCKNIKTPTYQPTDHHNPLWPSGPLNPNIRTYHHTCSPHSPVQESHEGHIIQMSFGTQIGRASCRDIVYQYVYTSYTHHTLENHKS